MFRRMFAAVRHLARIESPEEVLSAMRAFFCTLAERLQSRDALEVARYLPREFATFLLSPPRAHGDIFSPEEFYFRMGARERVSAEVAAHHARIIGAVTGASLSPQGRAELFAVLPPDFRDLFEPIQEEAPRDFDAV